MTVPRSATLVAALTLVWLSRSAAGDARTTTIQENGEDIRVTRLDVTPADEPVPTFRYRLRHRPLDLVEGNAPQWYMRAFAEETRAWNRWNELSSDDSFDPYYNSGTPVSALSKDILTESRIFDYIVENGVVEGARRRGCDWGIRSIDRRGPAAIEILLPEFQEMRNLTRMTMRSVRHAVADGRHDDALRYLGAMYSIGRNAAAEPLAVCGLIGVAVADIASAGVGDLIASPGSPNLYWALTDLPSPPVSLREAIRSEVDVSFRVVPELKGAATAQRTDAEWDALWRRVTTSRDLYDAMHNEEEGLPTLDELAVAAVAPEIVEHARGRLVTRGWNKAEVDAMPVGRVMMIYSEHACSVAADAALKDYYTPITKRSIEPRAIPIEDREAYPFTRVLLPMLRACHVAEARCARTVAVLRVVEALRMHSARNAGNLPASLDEVTCVPVPENPMTGEPFLYKLADGVAVIDLPTTDGFPLAYRYEVAIVNAAE
ncbi:MAG: hypothetical protein ACRCT8_09345 [Lacipirellulaceae bacterium]